jgi:hypothetical protein
MMMWTMDLFTIIVQITMTITIIDKTIIILLSNVDYPSAIYRVQSIMLLQNFEIEHSYFKSNKYYFVTLAVSVIRILD